MSKRDRVVAMIARGAGTGAICDALGLTPAKFGKHVGALLQQKRIRRTGRSAYTVIRAKGARASSRPTPAAVPGIGERTVKNLFRLSSGALLGGLSIAKIDQTFERDPVPVRDAIRHMTAGANDHLLATWLALIVTGHMRLAEPGDEHSDRSTLAMGSALAWTFTALGAARHSAAMAAGRQVIGLALRGFGSRPIGSEQNFALLAAAMIVSDETIDRAVNDLAREDPSRWGSYTARRQRHRLHQRGWAMPRDPGRARTAARAPARPQVRTRKRTRTGVIAWSECALLWCRVRAAIATSPAHVRERRRDRVRASRTTRARWYAATRDRLDWAEMRSSWRVAIGA